MNTTEIKKRLTEIANSTDENIQKQVAVEALAYSSDNICDFFNDLLKYGCVSGMISMLIYYCDTHEFFMKHYDEIEELRSEYKDSTGLALNPEGDLMNWYSWFAFETVARNLAESFGIY